MDEIYEGSNAFTLGHAFGYQFVVALKLYLFFAVIIKLFTKKSFSFKYHFFQIFILTVLFGFEAFLSPTWRQNPVNIISVLLTFSLAVIAYKTMFPQKLYAFLKKLRKE